MMRKKRVRVSAVAMVTFRFQHEPVPSSSRDTDTIESLVDLAMAWGSLKVVRQGMVSLDS